MDFSLIKNNLENMGYKVSCFENKEDATLYLTETIKNTTVGFGGSMTVKEMDLYSQLAKENTVDWHWMPKECQSVPQAHKAAAEAEIYICSVNGIAETGEIINIDGTGNRVASTIFGHKKVIFVVGKNKIAPDYEKAMWRARNIASPKNAHRIGVATPCAVKGDKCYNCNSKGKICRSFSVFAEKPGGMEYEVVLINEELGY